MELNAEFGDEIIITDKPGESSVATLRETVTCILQDYYKRPRNLNPDDEKKPLIILSAKVIKSNIQSVDATNCICLTPANIALDTNLSYLLESLLLFLPTRDLEARAHITPLKLGLGIQLLSIKRIQPISIIAFAGDEIKALAKI